MREFCMSLSIEIRWAERVVILELAGRLSVLEPSLRDLAWQLIERGERHFVISLANVSYLDNSGLGQLCWIYTVLQNRGGDMVLIRPTPRIKTLLHITKLDTIFQSFERESEAVAAIQPLRSAVST
jgi:anti-anti-sigma factor